MGSLAQAVLLLAALVPPVPAAEGRADPGRASAAGPADPAAYVFTWDRYRTVAVVGDGVGTRRPGWVATWPLPAPDAEGRTAALPPIGEALPERWPRALVAYRVLAFRDAGGGIHLDARQALVGGSMAQDWSPDSFRIVPPGRIDTIDDEPTHTPHTGEIELIVPADDPRYPLLLRQVELAVGGGV